MWNIPIDELILLGLIIVLWVVGFSLSIYCLVTDCRNRENPCEDLSESDYSVCIDAFRDAFDGIAGISRYVDHKKAIEYAKHWNENCWDEEEKIRCIQYPTGGKAIRVPES